MRDGDPMKRGIHDVLAEWRAVESELETATGPRRAALEARRRRLRDESQLAFARAAGDDDVAGHGEAAGAAAEPDSAPSSADLSDRDPPTP